MSTAIFALFFVVPLLLAVGLLYAGRRRRVGDEPHCRGCNYLLHGIQSERCPECGTALWPLAIVRGEPTRRWAPFVAGWLMIVLTALFLAGDVAGRLGAVNWYQYTPTYFVLRDLSSNQPANVQRAWTELMKRDAAGSLSATARDRLVRFALTQQATAAYPFTPMDTAAVNYLAARWQAGDLPVAQQTKAFAQSVRLVLQLRPKVIVGDWLPCMVTHDGLGLSANNLWMRVSSHGATVDGKSVMDGGVSGDAPPFGSGGNGSTLECPPIAGKHDVTLTYRIEVFKGPMGLLPSSTVLYSADRTLTGSVEMLATEPSGYMQRISSPAVAAAMKAAFDPTGFRYLPGQKLLYGGIDVSPAPVNLVCDVIARYGGKEIPIGRLICHPTDSRYIQEVSNKVESPVSATIDIILRPSDKTARETVDIQSYWNQEIVFQNVPVAQGRAQDSSALPPPPGTPNKD